MKDIQITAVYPEAIPKEDQRKVDAKLAKYFMLPAFPLLIFSVTVLERTGKKEYLLKPNVMVANCNVVNDHFRVHMIIVGGKEIKDKKIIS